MDGQSWFGWSAGWLARYLDDWMHLWQNCSAGWAGTGLAIQFQGLVVAGGGGDLGLQAMVDLIYVAPSWVLGVM